MLEDFKGQKRPADMIGTLVKEELNLKKTDCATSPEHCNAAPNTRSPTKRSLVQPLGFSGSRNEIPQLLDELPSNDGINPIALAL